MRTKSGFSCIKQCPRILHLTVLIGPSMQPTPSTVILRHKSGWCYSAPSLFRFGCESWLPTTNPPPSFPDGELSSTHPPNRFRFSCNASETVRLSKKHADSGLRVLRGIAPPQPLPPPRTPRLPLRQPQRNRRLQRSLLAEAGGEDSPSLIPRRRRLKRSPLRRSPKGTACWGRRPMPARRELDGSGSEARERWRRGRR